MPTLHRLLPDPVEQDQEIELEAPDPENNPQDPAHPAWLEELLWTPGVAEQLYAIASFLAEERSNGYSITPTMWPEEPSEDSRDWGIWAFHGTLIFDLYED